MRLRTLYAVIAALVVNVAPVQAQSATLDRATLIALVKHVWAAGSWEQQRERFEQLPERERAAVWAALVDVRPGPVRTEGPASSAEDAQFGPCQDQNVEECNYAPAPQPQPTAKPGSSPSRPPVVTPPERVCTYEEATRAYAVLGEPELYAFVYVARLYWCYMRPSVSGPLTEYSSFSYPNEDCCLFPWTTDPARYIDRVVGQPAANTLTIIDHHTGWFQAEAALGPVQAGLTNTPSIDSKVLSDGSFVCSG